MGIEPDFETYTLPLYHQFDLAHIHRDAVYNRWDTTLNCQGAKFNHQVPTALACINFP